MPVGGLVPKVAQAQTTGPGQEMRQEKTETEKEKQEGGDAREGWTSLYSWGSLCQILMFVNQTKRV